MKWMAQFNYCRNQRSRCKVHGEMHGEMHGYWQCTGLRYPCHGYLLCVLLPAQSALSVPIDGLVVASVFSRIWPQFVR